MSNLVEHAERELALCGQTAEDPQYAASIMEAVRAFAAYDGHSGASATFAVEQLARLLRFEALSPLTSDPAEWFDHGEMGGACLWQNRRDSRAFSNDAGKTWWMVDEKQAETAETDVPSGGLRGSQVIEPVTFPPGFVPPSASPYPTN